MPEYGISTLHNSYMGFFNWFRKKEPAHRKLFSADWHPIGSYGGSRNDTYGRREPGPFDLIAAFDDTVYSCATLIANKIASTPIHLYVKTDPSQARPKCATRPISMKTRQRLGSTKLLASQTRVEQVVNHPALDLLRKCNSYHNQGDLLCLTELYLEITGNAFWLVKPDNFGIPTETYLLPSQFVTPDRDEAGMVRAWRFGQGNKEVVYDKNEILHFKFTSLEDPYGLGMAPLRAAWDRVQIGMKNLGYLDATLSNGARPDAVLAPTEPISPFEAERLAKDFVQRFRGQGNGGIIVADGPMTVTPIGWPPRDLAELKLYQTIKTNVCNVFHVPPDIWEMGESNRATAEAALYALAVHCLKPRIIRIVEKLNERLIPMFDDSGRLFFQEDDIVPEDKTFELTKYQFLAATGSITRNEVRIREGLEPTDWGNEPLLPPGMLPMRQEEDQAEQELAPPPPPEEKDRSGQAPALAALQEAVYAGQLPREAAIANVQLTFGFSPESAAACFPPVQPVKLTPDEGPPQKACPSCKGSGDSNGNHERDWQLCPDCKGSGERTKAIKRKSPLPMAEALQKFFRRQKDTVLSKVKALDEAQTKAIPTDWLDIAHWDKVFADEMLPAVQMYWDYSAKQTVARLGGSHELWAVVQPGLTQAVEKQTLAFARSTNETTSMELGQALEVLKKELAEGLIAGDYQNALTERVQKVFDRAGVERAYLIAHTEASRSQHAAMEMTAIESGVATGKKWLLSADACDLCKPLENKVVPLGDNFVDGVGYGAVPFPPRHPACRCDCTETID